MDDTASRREYETRINRALDYMLRRLDAELSLEVLAREACFSPWHFHRIFTALMDETPDDYVRRLRLEKAASLLGMRPRQSITDIAMRCGFSTPSLFSRNFRKWSGKSPREWQEQRWSKRFEAESKNRQAAGNNRQEPDKIGQALVDPEQYHLAGKENGRKAHAEISVEVRRLDALPVAYVWHLRGYWNGVAESFDRIRRWAAARELLDGDSRFVGVNFDNPDVTPEDKCRLLACVSLPPGCDPARLPNSGHAAVSFTEIAGGLHACWPYRGYGRELKESYYEFYGHWLPESGLIPADSPGFMIYNGPPPVGVGLLLDCLVCIPVQPL